MALVLTSFVLICAAALGLSLAGRRRRCGGCAAASLCALREPPESGDER